MKIITLSNGENNIRTSKKSALRTEDCVEFLIKSKPGTDMSDWKRRSKSSYGPGVFLREFENVSTGDRVTVKDNNGVLSIVSSKDKRSSIPTFQDVGKDWVFAIINSDDFESGWGVAIGEKKVWEKRGYLSDRGASAEVNSVVRKIGLSEIMEGMFEPSGEYNKAQTRKFLLSVGFINDPGFQKFMEGHL